MGLIFLQMGTEVLGCIGQLDRVCECHLQGLR